MPKRAALAFVIGVGVVRGLAGCGSAQLVECRVDAVLALPLEPDQITLGDLKEARRKVNACAQSGAGDAGR
jgi:hypothetical protein